MRRSFRAHPYPPTPVPHACPSFHSQGCTLGWYALTLWVKRELALMVGPRRARVVASPTRAGTVRSCPPFQSPHACPPFRSQGCTLGWYALTLWVKRDLGLSRGGDGGADRGKGGRDMGPHARVIVSYRGLWPAVAEGAAVFGAPRRPPARAASPSRPHCLRRSCKEATTGSLFVRRREESLLRRQQPRWCDG